MIPPDYPRLPHSYQLQQAEISKIETALSSTNPSENSTSSATLRAAAALVLSAHAGEDRYAFEAERGEIIEGELDREGSDGNLNLLRQVGQTRAKVEEDQVRLQVLCEGGQQTTPLQLVFVDQTLSLNYDSSLLSQLDARWFLSHVASAYASLLPHSTSPVPLRTITVAPPSESKDLAKLSRASPPPSAYPDDCTTLPSFYLHAASLYPDDPALHFASSSDSPSSSDLILSYSQLHHLSRFLAQRLLSSVTTSIAASPSSYVVPLCTAKSPQMIISMLAITLAGFGYLALEPSWPEERKKVILRELKREGLLAGVGIVQAGEDDGEVKKWSRWKAEEGEERLLDAVIEPNSILEELLEGNLETVERDFPLAREWVQPESEENGIAYVIYTSGTTGVPKGIVVQHRNVAAFLRSVSRSLDSSKQSKKLTSTFPDYRNYRGVFGRARGERVLQFPSYSFDVSVMNIWDAFAVSLFPPFTSNDRADLPCTI